MNFNIFSRAIHHKIFPAAVIFLTAAGFTMVEPVTAQTVNDPVLMTIGSDQVHLSEFKTVFMKNNKRDSIKSNNELEEYIELFTNYKLKVKEARTTGMDTTASFKSELAGYRAQLAKPYLTDTAAERALLKEAYTRKVSDVKASHILVKVAPDAEAKDTATAYKRIMALRSRLLKGEAFEKVAREASEDPSAKENGGNLGWFTVFQMVYPFESAAYAAADLAAKVQAEAAAQAKAANAKPNDVSMPVRTIYGYHLMKITGKRDALGQMRAGHILIAISGKTKDDSLKAKKAIDDAYAKLKAGEKFEDVAKLSHDKASAMKGGELPAFGTGKMVERFEEEAYALKNDKDFSLPFLTEYGWHIIRRIERKPLPSFDELKEEIKNQLQKDSRFEVVKNIFVRHVKKEYGFKENTKALKALYAAVDNSVFDGKWKKPASFQTDDWLFSLGTRQYMQSEFLSYIEKNQKKKAAVTVSYAVNEYYNKFTDGACAAYEDKNLERKYPDFAALMKEYTDGILLFDLTDKKVWSRAIKDTVGLIKFYEVNKKNYMWDERADVAIYKCNDAAAAAQTRKLVEKQAKKGWSNAGILKQINTDSTKKVLDVEEARYLKNENDLVKSIEWKEGLSKNIEKDKKIVFLNVKKILKPEPKTLREARGLVTTDFQNYLEREWMDELRKKYPVSVNKDVENTIKP